MFKKLAYFTDLHYGRSSNSPTAIADNNAFVDWFIAEAKARGCETFIFGGDWFDNRLSINVNTLDAALTSIEKIAAAFEETYFLLGNHDLYFREQRSVASVSFARHIKNVNIVSEPTKIGEVVLLPWLVGDEHKAPLPSGRYTFAHLEMPGFMMNAKSIMPDSDHLMKVDALADHGTVFTGHFHMRQTVGNIVYTGNVMPFDFSDNWDEARGAMFLDHGGEPEFVAWPDQPLYRTMKLSDMMAEPEKYLKQRLTAKVYIDIDINYEEAQTLKEHYVGEYGLRKLELVPLVKDEEQQNTGDEITFQSIDQIVIDALLGVKSPGLKADKLVALYRTLA